MMEWGRPIICATSMARLRPGMPAIMRYVGCAVAASNSIDAFTMRLSLTAKLFSAERCVVTIISAPVSRRCSITAVAIADPSSGSVPDPSSSSSTSERSVTRSRTRRRRTRYAENVERCSSTLWSSPIRTWKSSTIGMWFRPRRHRQSAHGHGHEQSGRFQRDRLAAGVRTADDERGAVAIELDRNRDDLAVRRLFAECLRARRRETFIEQRMASVDDFAGCDRR